MGIAVDHFHGSNVWTLLQLRTQASGARPAFIWHPYTGEGRTWTYEELERDASRVAAGLARRGVRAGDYVILHLENCPEFVLAWYACAALGAVAVCTNTRSSDEELRYFTDHSGAVGVITQPRFAQRAAAAAPAARWIVVTDHDAGVPGAVIGGEGAFSSLLAETREFQPAPPDPRAPMCVQYTSGTTSRPKAVLWTHANALWGAKVNASHLGLRPDDSYLCYLPLFHTNALAYTMLGSLWAGGHFVLVPKWSTSRFWDVSRRYGCTWVNLILLSFRAIEALPPDVLLVITSDHGNIEDLSTKSHTLNDVATILKGPGSEAAAEGIRSLTDITPAILGVIG